MRLIFAVVVAPFLGALVGALIGGLIGVQDATRLQISPSDAFTSQFVHWLPWIAGVTCPCTIIFGLPIHYALQRTRSTGAFFYCVIGLGLGLVVILLGALITLGDRGALYDSLSDALPFLPVGGGTGAATGFFAWLMRRPDRDAPTPPTPAP